MAINIKYSYKSFKRKSLLPINVIEFNNSEIVGSSFYQEEPYTDVFPNNINGTRFIRCNLDNCNIPSGAIVEGGSNRHIKKQNDQEYWTVGKDLKPIQPMNVSNFVKCGLSYAVVDIPLTPLSEPITYTNDPQKIEQDKINAFLSDPVKVREAALKESASFNIKAIK